MAGADRVRTRLRLATPGALRLRPALLPRRADGVGEPDRSGPLRVGNGEHAAVRAAAVGVRPGDQLCPVRRDPRGRDRDRHLLLGRRADPDGDDPLTALGFASPTRKTPESVLGAGSIACIYS